MVVDFQDFLEVVKKMEAQSKGWAHRARLVPGVLGISAAVPGVLGISVAVRWAHRARLVPLVPASAGSEAWVSCLGQQKSHAY